VFQEKKKEKLTLITSVMGNNMIKVGSFTDKVSNRELVFDVFKCVVDEVSDVYETSSGKQMIEIKIGDQKFVGSYDQDVHEFLIDNEGSESFVVLWRSHKGGYMVAYNYDYWLQFQEGKLNLSDTPLVSPNTTTKEAFVYMWLNTKTGRKYIGYHAGSPNDGYIGSGVQFLQEYNANPSDFIRTIIAQGGDKAMYKLETMLILLLEEQEGYYNLGNNLK
jgi:hypothetical protein